MLDTLENHVGADTLSLIDAIEPEVRRPNHIAPRHFLESCDETRCGGHGAGRPCRRVLGSLCAGRSFRL